MDANQNPVNWLSADNHLLLNPRWSKAELHSLQEVAETVSKDFTLTSHLWLATSGSTAETHFSIKLVALSKAAFLASARAVNDHLKITEKDIWLQVLPRFHVGGLGIEVRALLSQSKIIQDFEKWDPQRIASVMEEKAVTLASFVPTQIFDFVRGGLPSPSTLRAVVVGGGALDPALYLSARKLGWPLLPSYGMSETCSQIATATLESLTSREKALPRPRKLSHVQWRKSQEGLLEVHGGSLLSLYGQRQKDGRILGWDPKVLGWFHTEDLVELHGDEIVFLGRLGDFIKIGGEGSSLGRLRGIFEKILFETDPQKLPQMVLVDAPSPRLGTEIHLVYEGRIQEKLLLEIKEKYNQQVLPFERIREVRVLGERSQIPRSELGKVLWAKLKKELYGD
jgi:O-succinylbenzoic acid--CoA ligase